MPKKANLKNYTTTVPASKSISEIQDLLIRFGAQNIIMDSDGERIIAIKFTYPFNDMILPFMLSVNIENTTELL